MKTKFRAMKCNQCGGILRVGPSAFDGFNVLACEDCGRPVRLIGKDWPSYPSKKLTRAEENRALRAARRMKQRRV